MLSLDSYYKPLYVYAERHAQANESLYRRAGKRLFDVCFSLFILIVVLSWLLPILGVLILLDSPGPIFYIQKRTGYRGSWFKCLKLRTMTYNPNASFRQASKNDNRVTRIGRFLRQSNLDELPQFINVLRGDMSIVGPRPHALEHSAQFWHSMPEYKKRYRVKPGITGLAQVCGCRGETSERINMLHRVRYDRFYNRNQSFGLDVWICWRTLKQMIRGNINAW